MIISRWKAFQKWTRKWFRNCARKAKQRVLNFQSSWMMLVSFCIKVLIIGLANKSDWTMNFKRFQSASTHRHQKKFLMNFMKRKKNMLIVKQMMILLRVMIRRQTKTERNNKLDQRKMIKKLKNWGRRKINKQNNSRINKQNKRIRKQ